MYDSLKRVPGMILEIKGCRNQRWAHRTCKRDLRGSGKSIDSSSTQGYYHRHGMAWGEEKNGLISIIRIWAQRSLILFSNGT